MNSWIAVGIGNSTVKLGVVKLPTRGPVDWLLKTERPTADLDPAEWSSQVPRSPACWYVASVHRPTEARLRAWVQSSRPADQYLWLTHHHIPLAKDVEAPERVGMDRLVAALAANRLRAPDRAAIVVDAGTAITVDVVDRNSVFRGGAILPGVGLSARALATFTDQLPRVDCRFEGDLPEVIGRETVSAIRSGLFYGCAGAIREIAQRMIVLLDEDADIFVTGGDAEILTSQIDPRARFVEDLVLAGIVMVAEDVPPESVQ